MIICHYCGSKTSDKEFCDNCSKFLGNTNVQHLEKSFQHKVEQYDRGTLNCIALPYKFDRKQIVYFNYDSIQNPLQVDYNDGKFYFIDKNEINLEDYIKNHDLNFDNIYKIVNDIGKILLHIQLQGYILGSFNISDFWINNNSLNIIYRQTRKVLKINDNLNNYSIGKICSPEVLSEDIESLDKTTDVYLLGKLFIELITMNKIYINDYTHERFIIYNLNLFIKDIPNGLQNWIGKSTNIYNEKRYSDIQTSLSELKHLYEVEKLREKDDYNILLTCEGTTDVGKGKLEKSKNKEKANEDSNLIIKHGEKLFIMVSDGVSNSLYGTGHDASNIVKDVCADMWNKRVNDLENKNDINNFIKSIIKESNKRIFESVKENISKYTNLEHGIMAATFSVAIIIKNKLYYTSLGDSPIYIINKNSISRLNVEDNYGNEKLREGISWEQFIDLESKSSLTKYIGGNFAPIYNEKSIIFELKTLNLVKDDIVLICSDGLTDYIGNILDGDDMCNRDNCIIDVFSNENKNLKNINSKLVDIANDNGGGDNITIVLVKAQ